MYINSDISGEMNVREKTRLFVPSETILDVNIKKKKNWDLCVKRIV